METKELKIQAPEGYEIDRENSTFECIKFKSIKKNITYKDVCNKLFEHSYYFINERGGIIFYTGKNKFDANNALDIHQLKRLLALNQLINIAEYYNKQHPEQGKYLYCIIFKERCGYEEGIYDLRYTSFGLVALFNRKEDVKAVIDNPNFRKILDTIYKN